MDFEKSGRRLNVKLRRDFNLLTARKIARLAEDADELSIDLARSRIVNSEALILLYTLVRAGKHVTLKNPRSSLRVVLEEAIHVLGLESVLDLDELIE
jgi:hypothetical protein